MPAKKKQQELAQFENPVLADPEAMSEVLEVLQENLGDSTQMGLSDLDRVSVPNGGKSFIVPTLDGDETETDLTGVVILARNNRAYWPTNDISDEAPQCYSDDGITGHGTPGGACATCPLAQFGSAAEFVDGAKGQGQACKQTVQIFLLTEDGFLPKVLRLPPTSLREWRSYMVALTGRRLKATQVLTRFEIEVDKNDAGQPYSKITPRFAGRLGEDGREQVARLADVLVPRLRLTRSLPPSQDEVVADA